MLGHRSVKSTEVYARSLEEVPEECMVRLRSFAAAMNSTDAAIDWVI